MIFPDERFPIMTQKLLDTIPMKGFQLMPWTKDIKALIFVQGVIMDSWTINYLKEVK